MGMVDSWRGLSHMYRSSCSRTGCPLRVQFTFSGIWMGNSNLQNPQSITSTRNLSKTLWRFQFIIWPGSLPAHITSYLSSVHIHQLHFMAAVEATVDLIMRPFIDVMSTTIHETTNHPTFHTLPDFTDDLQFIEDMPNGYYPSDYLSLQNLNTSTWCLAVFSTPTLQWTYLSSQSYSDFKNKV